MIVKWYTRASRVRIVIAKFDGRWRLPGGPYPIPELIAVVGGILGTLMALPRLGHPIATGVVGIAVTSVGVAVMRRMPYSPVRFQTRIHRIWRLYTAPRSLSIDDRITSAATTSVVRPEIEFLDALTDDADAPAQLRDVSSPPPPQGRLAGMFDQQPSPVADLFG